MWSSELVYDVVTHIHSFIQKGWPGQTLDGGITYHVSQWFTGQHWRCRGNEHQTTTKNTEITNWHPQRTIPLMDSNGQRMITHLQNQIQDIEYQPTYTTEEQKQTAHTIKDLTKNDRILNMTGTNDARNHTPRQQAAENIRETIDVIKANNPEVKIILSQPPSITTMGRPSTW